MYRLYSKYIYILYSVQYIVYSVYILQYYILLLLPRKSPITPQTHTISINLTAGGLDTGSLDLLGRFHVSTTGPGILNFISTLGSFHFLLLLFGFLGGSSAGSLLDTFGFGTLGNDFFPGGTDDGTLDFDGLAGTALGDFLGGSLLVETAVEDGPVEFTGVLLGFEVGSALSIQ